MPTPARLRSHGITAVSELGLRVYAILDDLYQGIYHLPAARLRNMEWSNPHYICVTVDGSRFATFDFNDLTKLVFLAHDYMTRVEIVPAMRYLRLGFSPRTSREDTAPMHTRHPSLEDAFARHRRTHPDPDIWRTLDVS